MPILTTVFAGLAAVFHVLFFWLESIAFPRVYRRFGLKSPEEAGFVRGFAFNQGFYNLFLALGCLYGLATDDRSAVWFACLVMVGAGLVLVGYERKMWRAALIQAVPPALAIVTDLTLR